MKFSEFIKKSITENTSSDKEFIEEVGDCMFQYYGMELTVANIKKINSDFVKKFIEDLMSDDDFTPADLIRAGKLSDKIAEYVKANI